MKRFIFSLLMLVGVASGSETVTLDTKLVKEDGEVMSLYSCSEEELSRLNRAAAFGKMGRESKVTFYIDVDQLYGARKLEKGKKYRLDTFSWHGYPSGAYTGQGRRVIISNGVDEMKRRIPQTTSDKVTVRQRSSEHPFTFTTDDILEVTLSWEGEHDDTVAIRFYDAPPAPAKIRGTAFSLTDDEEINDGDASRNVYVQQWRYNCPVIRIRATRVDELDIRQIGMIAGGVILVLLVLRFLVGSSQKKVKKS